MPEFSTAHARSIYTSLINLIPPYNTPIKIFKMLVTKNVATFFFGIMSCNVFSPLDNILTTWSKKLIHPLCQQRQKQYRQSFRGI